MVVRVVGELIDAVVVGGDGVVGVEGQLVMEKRSCIDTLAVSGAIMSRYGAAAPRRLFLFSRHARCRARMMANKTRSRTSDR